MLEGMCRSRLRKNAEPTLFEEGQGFKDTSHKGSQTPPQLSLSTPRKPTLRAEIHNLKRRCIRQSFSQASQPAQDDCTKENFIRFCKNTFSTGMANFFITQIELASKKPNGSRYSDFFKQFALTVYFLGPSVYRFLKETFRLPSKSTLCRWLNSYQYASKEFNRPFVGSRQQIIFLNSMKNEFKTLKIINSVGKDVTRTMKFLDGWQTTITGCLMLWEDLQPTTKVIFMRRLNQDCLENMFGSIRQKGGCNLNPTPIQFHYAFKKIFCLNFFRHVDGANCIPDIDELLSTFNIEEATNATEVILANSVKENIFNEVLHINPNDYFNTQLPAKNALAWVSGYLMKKCLTKHICELCEKFSQENSEILQNETMLCYFRAYENGQKNTFGNLTMPPNSFYLYIFHLDTTFCELFPKLSIEDNIGHKIKLELQKIPFAKPCDDFNIDYLLSLFVRMKVFYTLKYANRSFREPNHGRHSKTNKKIINLLHL